MPILRVLLAGLVALFAVLATALAAVFVVLAGLVAWVAQLFRPKSTPAQTGPSSIHSPRKQTGDVIEVVTTRVPPEI
jgi:hypothetical protein